MVFKHPASGSYSDDAIKSAIALNIALALLDCPLSPADKKFSQSLLDDFIEGKATHKQQYWLGVMADKAVGKPKIAPSSMLVLGGYAGVYALFQKATASKLKHPKIKLMLPTYMEGEQIGDGQYATKTVGGSELQLSLAGAKSKYKGKIMVTDGKPYGQNKWYGTIDNAGVFAPSKLFGAQPGQLQADIAKLLGDLGEKPAEVAAVYGQKTGHCCFCGLGLTDPKSVTVGYGPICAGKYGLPWGFNMFSPVDVEKLAAAKLADAKNAIDEATTHYDKAMKTAADNISAPFKPYQLKAGTKIEFNPKPGSITGTIADAAKPLFKGDVYPKSIAEHVAAIKSEPNPVLPAPARKKQEFLF